MKNCVHCGLPFQPRSNRQRFCSIICRTANQAGVHALEVRPRAPCPASRRSSRWWRPAARVAPGADTRSSGASPGRWITCRTAARRPAIATATLLPARTNLGDPLRGGRVDEPQPVLKTSRVW